MLAAGQFTAAKIQGIGKIIASWLLMFRHIELIAMELLIH